MKNFRKAISLSLLLPMLILNASFTGLGGCVTGKGIAGMTCCTAEQASTMVSEVAFSLTTCGCQITTPQQANVSAMLVEVGKSPINKIEKTLWYAPVMQSNISSTVGSANHLTVDLHSHDIRHTKIYDFISAYLI